MCRVRKPADDAVLPLRGADIKSGDSENIGENITENDQDSQAKCAKKPAYLPGNKCGHNKHHFRFPDFSYRTKRRPHVIEELKRRLKDAIANPYKYPALLPLIYNTMESISYDESKGPVIRITGEIAGNRNYQSIKKIRIRRSCKRESILSLVLYTLIDGMNLKCNIFGFYNSKNHFHYFDYSKIQEIAKISYIRLKRAMDVLKEEGICEVIPIYEENEEATTKSKIRTIRTIIKISPKIFEILGLRDELNQAQEEANEKFYVEQKRITAKQQLKLIRANLKNATQPSTFTQDNTFLRDYNNSSVIPKSSRISEILKNWLTKQNNAPP